MNDIGLMSYYLDIEVKKEEKVDYEIKLSRYDEKSNVDVTYFKSLWEVFAI